MIIVMALVRLVNGAILLITLVTPIKCAHFLLGGAPKAIACHPNASAHGIVCVRGTQITNFSLRSELEFYSFTWERLKARAASTKRANYGEITEGFTIIRSPIETIIRERRKSLRF